MPESFQATPLSLGMFLNQPGQGFYLPIYQREYAWGSDEVVRLFEDFGYGIARLASSHDSATFLGSVITVEDRLTLHPVAAPPPTSVRQVIDGQQRIITCLAIARELGDALRERLSTLTAGDEIQAVAEMTANQLDATLTIDMGHGAEPFRHYPKIARAGRDKWSTNGENALYEDPVASYLFSTRAEPQPPDTARAFGRAVKTIQSQIQDWAEDDDVGRTLNTGEFSEHLSRRLLDSDFVPNADTDLQGLHLYRLALLGQFFLKEIQIISVEAPSEEYALALFEPLNTTGQLLTALETFKPLLVEAEGGASGYPGTPTERSYAQVALLLEDPKPLAKAKKTADLLVPFALSENGERLSRRLQDQRRYLRRTYGELENLPEKRAYVGALSNMARFVYTFWNKENPSEVTSPLDRVCLGLLRDSGHTIPQGLMARYYASEAANGTEDLLGALQAIAAFWTLWRVSRSTTQNIDSHYRTLLSTGVDISESVSSGPFCRAQSIDPPSVAELKRGLEYLLREKGAISDRDSWIDKVTSMNLYGGKALTRFVLLAAHHDAVADTENPGLIKEGAIASSNTLSWEHWSADYDIEHIAPQSVAESDESYDNAIYDNGLQNRLGNLTLIPRAENASLGNRSWPEKRFMYSVLGEMDPELRSERLDESGLGIELSPETIALLERSIHLPFCATVALNDSATWDAEFVTSRSRRLAGLAWDRISPWLFT